MLLRLVTCLPVIVALLQGCEAVQRWKQEPGTSEVNPGGNVVLACKIFNKRGTCSWQKDGKPQGMFVGKYEWSGNQEAGDCSIRILDAGEVDNGEWECQVTASSFTAHDALTSRIAEVIVRVAPRDPVLEVATHQFTSVQNFTVQENRPANIRCISRYGNPPAEIKWFIGDKEIPFSYYGQSNVMEMDRSRMWRAVSTLEYTYQKHHHGQYLRCRAYHKAYLSTHKSVRVVMDVQYAPTVRIEGAPMGDIEEGMDDVTLHCLVDANPPGNIVWRVLGDINVFSFLPRLKFNPVSRKHSATYTCEARNAVGGAEPVSVKVDVKYVPHIIHVGPSTQITSTLYNHTQLECLAEGNPAPRYTWYQTVPQTDHREIRGRTSSLLLESITYADQGQYVCVASNIIKGQPVEDVSQPVNLEVIGAPQVLRYMVEQNVVVEKGQDALIQIVFCSDPHPLRTTWQWDSLQLEAGNGRGHYIAENLAQDSHEDCYAARLRVQGADIADARDYVLSVVNDRGADSFAVGLLVKEPVALSTVIAIIIGCLFVLVVATLIILYAFKTEKWCFSQQGDFKPTDLESTKNDLDIQKGANDAASTNGNSKLLSGNEKQLLQGGEKR